MAMEFLNESSLSKQEKETFKKFLSNRKTNHKDSKDKLLWGASKDGNYRVKLGYEKIINLHQWDKIDIMLVK